MQDRDDALLLDMLAAARRVKAFTRGVDRIRSLKDEMLQSAVAYQFQIVGEAASRVSPGGQAMHPAIPWREIIGLRNRIVHGYLSVESNQIWCIVETHVEPLIAVLSGLVPPEDDSN